MPENRILFAIPSIFFILLHFFSTNSTAQNNNNNNCASSSCGNIKINHPFRLTTAPKTCGYDDPRFELECRNNQTIFKVRSRSYVVQDINYESYSIRLVDPTINSANLSSCPLHSNDYDAWPYIFTTFFFDTNIPVSFIYCSAPVNSSNYVEGPFCGNRSRIFSNSSQIYSYVRVGDPSTTGTVPDVEGSCRVDRVVWTSGRRGMIDNSSLAGIYDGLGYGVELTWFRALCGECESNDGYCSLNGNRITCKYYCMESTPISQRSFICQLEYYGTTYGLIASGALVVLRFLIGFAFLIGLMVSQWRKRHLPIISN